MENTKSSVKKHTAALWAGVFAFICGGCPTNTNESNPVPSPNIAFQDTVEGINAAFSSEYPSPVVSTVYLSGDVKLGNGTLIIPLGKTLNLSGYTIKDIGDNGTIVSAGYMDFSQSGTTEPVINMGKKGYIIAEEKFIEEQTYTNPVDAAGKHILIQEGYAIPIGATDKEIAAVYSDQIPDTLGKIKTLYIIGNYTFADNKCAGIENITIIGNAIVGDGAAFDTNKNLSVTGKISSTVDSFDIKSNLTAQTADFTKAGVFGGTVSFTGSEHLFDAADFRGNALFGGWVEFNGDAVFNGQTVFNEIANFTNAKFYGETVFNTMATFSDVYIGTGALVRLAENSIANLNIDGGGKVIYTNKLNNSELLSTAGTIDSGAGGSLITLKAEGNSLDVQGTGGTFGLNNTHIKLTSSDNFVLGSSVSVIFSGAGSLAAASYTLGSGAGTLSSIGKTTFKSDSIEGGTEGAIAFTQNDFLNIKQGGTLTLDKLNIDLTQAGSIAFGAAGRLLITNGGSVTTGAEAANIAWDGVIAGSAGQGGVLLTGTLSDGGSILAGSILAGSLGTLSLGNFITRGESFAKVMNDTTLTGSIAQYLPTDGDGGSASIGGSILIFNEL